MLSKFLLILEIVLFGYACRTFQAVAVRKVGLLAFMGATCILFLGLTGSWIVGAASMLL
ncbi:MAG: hypothetical protein ACI8T1_001200 [Verrucomicrobiales bacterium]|jgi:hypothetical protein